MKSIFKFSFISIPAKLIRPQESMSSLAFADATLRRILVHHIESPIRKISGVLKIFFGENHDKLSPKKTTQILLLVWQAHCLADLASQSHLKEFFEKVFSFISHLVNQSKLPASPIKLPFILDSRGSIKLKVSGVCCLNSKNKTSHINYLQNFMENHHYPV